MVEDGTGQNRKGEWNRVGGGAGAGTWEGALVVGGGSGWDAWG